MKISIKEKEIEINEIKNIYPSAIVKMPDGEKTPISIEWANQNSDKIEICGYAILILLKKDSEKIEINFEKFEEMIDTLKFLHENLRAPLKTIYGS